DRGDSGRARYPDRAAHGREVPHRAEHSAKPHAPEILRQFRSVIAEVVAAVVTTAEQRKQALDTSASTISLKICVLSVSHLWLNNFRESFSSCRRDRRMARFA